jgi:hypothetical protein
MNFSGLEHDEVEYNTIEKNISWDFQYQQVF